MGTMTDITRSGALTGDREPPSADALGKIIRPIVEGQIRGFLKEHPPIVEAVDWYKPRKDKATTLVNSLSKRIVRDLLCPTTRARLEAAFVELASVTPPDSTVAPLLRRRRPIWNSSWVGRFFATQRTHG